MVVELVGHWGVGKTSLAQAIVEGLKSRCKVVSGREYLSLTGAKAAIIAHPSLAYRALSAAGGCLPEAVVDPRVRKAIGLRIRQEFTDRFVDSVVVLDRGATTSACSLLTELPRAFRSDRLVRALVPRNRLTILVEAHPATVQERISVQPGRDPATHRGALAYADLTSPEWEAALDGYKRVRRVLLQSDRKVLIVDNSGALDAAEACDAIVAAAPPSLLLTQTAAGSQVSRTP